MTRVGFTGTQVGMSPRQKLEFLGVLQSLQPDELHHGDCIGADEEAHYISKAYSDYLAIHIHPPEISTKRAYCVGGTIYLKAPYIERNHHIVDATDVLIAAPRDEKVEELRSGTWATIRYARKQGKRVIILPR